MAPVATDIHSRISDLDAIDPATGETFIFPWGSNSDDHIAIDLGPALDDGETITNPVCTLWKLRSMTPLEASDTDASAKLVGTPTIESTFVLQRASNLDAGRYYRLKVLHGSTGNRRENWQIVYVPE